MRAFVRVAIIALTMLAAAGPAALSGADAVSTGGSTAAAGTIGAGGGHSCAVTADGALKCWGNNESGQLGDATTSDRASPTAVSGLASGVRAVSAGLSHTCALATNGGVKCWGRNGQGQLGDGTTTSQTQPVDVSGLGSGVAAIAAGHAHTCALTTGGGVKCWGNNTYGQIGDGGACGENCRTPQDVSGLGSGVSAIAVGGHHTCALTDGGGVLCWGDNTFGQVGDGTTEDRNAPVDVTGLSSGISVIGAGGGGHTCAAAETAGLKCWGNNEFGQLGEDRGCRTPCVTPADVQGLTSRVVDVAGGYFFTCALTEAGAVKCWGNNDFGKLGDNRVCGGLCGVPVDVIGLASGAAAVATGSRHACAATAAGDVLCWGDNFDGQLGDGGECGTRCFSPVEVGLVPALSGDANCDGRTNSIDAALVLQFVAALLSALSCPDGADVNGDGLVNAIDATLILQYSAGLLPGLPP